VSINKKLFACFVIALGLIPLAEAKDDVLVNCHLTPSIPAPEHYPGVENIPTTNDLRRKTGSAVIAKGQPMRLIGRVVDENCVPVADAKVEIWQANFYGYYQDEAKKIDEVNDENFLGAGEYITNNLGQFDFISIKPGALGWKAPQIHIKITKEGFDEVNTTLYFEDEPKTDSDPAFAKLTPDIQKLLIARRRLLEDKKDPEIYYYFDVALRGKNSTVGY